ncbi:hypothetical protein M885DRAFT_558965 [Pelagophyceae sp. CCMP2097]|nr:hypothetical protein M885DRAFT_558965 [Pelagophyceae sp. CCMP2097]
MQVLDSEDAVREVLVAENPRLTLIVGCSGSGKTQLLRRVAERPLDLAEVSWDPLRSVGSQVGPDAAVACARLMSAGVNSFPRMANGAGALPGCERVLASMARVVESGCGVDDLARGLDDDSARCVANALRATVQKHALTGIVAATARHDLAPWAQPDVVVTILCGTGGAGRTFRLERNPLPAAGRAPEVRVDCEALSDQEIAVGPSVFARMSTKSVSSVDDQRTRGCNAPRRRNDWPPGVLADYDDRFLASVSNEAHVCPPDAFSAYIACEFGIKGTFKLKTTVRWPREGDLPADFEILVVCGDLGTGKTKVLDRVFRRPPVPCVRPKAALFDPPLSREDDSTVSLLDLARAVEARPRQRGETVEAACSVEEASRVVDARALSSAARSIDTRALERLRATGLSPAASMATLSRSERALARCVLDLGHGCAVDDFLVGVDAATAERVAVSVAAFIRKRGMRRVVFATSMDCVVDALRPCAALRTDGHLRTKRAVTEKGGQPLDGDETDDSSVEENGATQPFRPLAPRASALTPSFSGATQPFRPPAPRASVLAPSSEDADWGDEEWDRPAAEDRPAAVRDDDGGGDEEGALMDFFDVQSAPERGSHCEDAGAAPPSAAGEAAARVWDDRQTIWAPPLLKVTLRPCLNSVFEQGFQEDHYMAEDPSSAMRSWIGALRVSGNSGGRPKHVVFVSSVSHIGDWQRRESRIVVRPQFQGLGIGAKTPAPASNAHASMHFRAGRLYYSLTHHARLLSSRGNSLLWRTTNTQATMFVGSSEDAALFRSRSTPELVVRLLKTLSTKARVVKRYSTRCLRCDSAAAPLHPLAVGKLNFVQCARCAAAALVVVEAAAKPSNKTAVEPSKKGSASKAKKPKLAEANVKPITSFFKPANCS